MPEPDRSAVMDLSRRSRASVVRIKPRPALEPANDDADPAGRERRRLRAPRRSPLAATRSSRGGTPRLIAALVDAAGLDED
jgi:hypothetical protein